MTSNMDNSKVLIGQ